MSIHSRFAPLALVAASILVGCASDEHRYDPGVAVQGEPVSRNAPLTIDVENTAGSVTINIDPRADSPRITARMRGTIGSRFDVPERHAVQATLSEGDRPALRVVNAPADAPAGLLTDIRIVVPRATDVSVRNGSGGVVVRGATGRIEVDNGYSSAEGGDIEVRFTEPIGADISATTPSGGILIVGPQQSQGSLDLASADGIVGLYAASEHVDDVHTQRSSFRGVLNSGENPIRLRSGRGSVRLIISSKPISLVDRP